MTLLYKSFKSDEAYLPPSSCTIGLKSGGKTGKTSINIHSGLIFALNIPWKSFNLLKTFFFMAGGASLASWAILSVSFFKSIFENISFTTSAPVPASKTSPYFMEIV